MHLHSCQLGWRGYRRVAVTFTFHTITPDFFEIQKVTAELPPQGLHISHSSYYYDDYYYYYDDDYYYYYYYCITPHRGGRNHG